MKERGRRLLIRSAGLLIILIALGALLLPLAEHIPARQVIGWMLLLAGSLELAAAAAMQDDRPPSLVAALVTISAGLRLLLDSGAGFFEVLNLVILWLVVRAGVFALPVLTTHRALRPWTALAAAVDFLLGIALLAGLPIALIVVGLFGPSRPVTATFAWVLAVSFLANGARLVADPGQNNATRQS